MYPIVRQQRDSNAQHEFCSFVIFGHVFRWKKYLKYVIIWIVLLKRFYHVNKGNYVKQMGRAPDA